MSGDETPEQTTTVANPAGAEPANGKRAAVTSAPEPADATVLIEQHEHREHKQRRWGEYLAFFVLAIILIGSICVVAVASPIIFDRVIPAVMGWETFPAAETTPEGVPGAAPSESPGGGSETDPGAGAGGLPENESGSPDTETTPVITTTQTVTTSTPAVITHTVSAGETLFQISRQYSVTVEAIVAANNIFNPELITPGDVLTIPTE